MKNGVLEHKSGNISETRKDRGKVTMDRGPVRNHQRSFERYHPFFHPDLLRPPLSQDCGSQLPLPKTPIAIISGTDETTYFKIGKNLVHPNKSPLKCWRKGSVGVARDCPIFGYLLLSQERVKLRTSNFVRTFIGSIGKKHIKNFRKSRRGRSLLSDSRKFSGYP